MAVDFTPVLKLAIPDPNQSPWDVDVNDNWSIIDSIMGQLQSIPNFQGVWLNATAYAVGQSVVDVANSSVWQCNVAHTSAALGTTFAQDRTANPNFWGQLLGPGFSPTGAVAKSGDTMTGTLTMAGGRISFANRLAPANNNVSTGIDFFGGTYGIALTSNRLNYNVVGTAAHKFLVGGNDRFSISSTDVSTPGHFGADTVTFTHQGIVGGGGWVYNGTTSPTGASHAIAFAWAEPGHLNQLSVYIDGLLIGRLTPV